MEVNKIIVALFLLCLAATTSVGWCRMVDTSPQEVTHDQGTQRDARADWAASKISEGIGASSNGERIMASSKASVMETIGEKLYEVKSHTTGKTSVIETAKETATNAYESMTGQGRKTMESASEMADEAKNEANKAYEASGPTLENAGNTASEYAGKAKEEASKAYEASGPTMESAGNIASEMAEKIKEGAQSAYEYAMGTVHLSMGEEIQHKASDAMSWTSEKAAGAKEVMTEKASDAYNSVSGKTGETVRMAAETTNSASYEQAREKSYDAYLYTGHKFEGAKEAAAAHAGNI